MDDKEIVELTADTYYDFLNKASAEIRDTKKEIDNLSLEFDDKKRIIKISKEQIFELRNIIRATRKEKNQINQALSEKERFVRINISFINRLNKTINKKKGGAHLIDYQKKKILKQKNLH